MLICEQLSLHIRFMSFVEVIAHIMIILLHYYTLNYLHWEVFVPKTSSNCGPFVCSLYFRVYETIDDVDIDLHINVSFLDEEVASAWKVTRTEPIILRLRFSLSQYLDGPEPTVEVFQPTCKDGFCLGVQLKRILSTFISNQWKHLSNEFLNAQQRKRHSWFKAGGTIKKFRVMKYSEQRIPTLKDYCVVCDEQHVFQNGSMLKPAVCTRELCVFSFNTLGVMSGAAEDVATGAEVVDLLVAMCRAALESARKSIIFDPYPSVVDPHDPKSLAFNPKKKSYERLQRALDGITSIREITQGPYFEITKQMDKLDPLAHPLLQWIISSNRSHIVKLPSSRQLKFMHTSHQFLLLSSPPAKEARFHTARKLHGSTFAFHGSHIENWHSILRNGLVNTSYTKLQLHRAAYGKGIYLSPISSISFGYSGKSFWALCITAKCVIVLLQCRPTQSRFLQSRNLNCVALCEVITSNDLQKHGNIWVCPISDHVCTRFFFVYEDGQVGDANINTQDVRIQKEILRVIGGQST
uniref:Poly [ADP-ribose] polymerase n=1 Tax=Sinocyclocheilus rhinocerous TaxID=307959 RepID=A0A673JX39_9TELE